MPATFITGKQSVKDMSTRRSIREIERANNLNGVPIGLTQVPNQMAIPVGGLVLHGNGPSVGTPYGASTAIALSYDGAFVTPSPAVILLVGLQYEVTVSLSWSQQITNATTQAQIILIDSASLLPNTRIIGTVGLNGFFSGSVSRIITPTTTVSEIFTVNGASSSASLQINAFAVDLIVKRVT